MPAVASMIARYRRESPLSTASATARPGEQGGEGVVVAGDQPYKAIIEVAEQQGVGMVMMASHGRSGLQALLLGSETQKVLTHSKVPVLVFR